MSMDIRKKWNTSWKPDSKERRQIPDEPHRAVKASYGMHYIVGNRMPYFSLTADTYRAERGTWKNDGGGCCHEDIAKAFPELAELIQFHLWDSDGLPMHYVANGLYWAELAAGVSQWQKGPHYLHGKTHMGILQGHCACGVLGDDLEVAEKAMGLANGLTTGSEFKLFLSQRIPAMKAAFDAAMKRHNIKMEPDGGK